MHKIDKGLVVRANDSHQRNAIIRVPSSLSALGFEPRSFYKNLKFRYSITSHLFKQKDALEKS